MTARKLYKPGNGPPMRKRAKQPMPLPIRFNVCLQCSHDNCAIEKVTTCRVCGSEIRPRNWETTLAPAQWNRNQTRS